MKRLLTTLAICLLTAHVAHAQVNLHGTYFNGQLQENVTVGGVLRTNPGALDLRFDSNDNGILGGYEFVDQFGLCEVKVTGTFDPPYVANGIRDTSTYSLVWTRNGVITYPLGGIPSTALASTLSSIYSSGGYVIDGPTQDTVSGSPQVEWVVLHLDFANVGGWQGCMEHGDPNRLTYLPHVDITAQGSCEAPDPSGLCSKAYTFGDCVVTNSCGKMIAY